MIKYKSLHCKQLSTLLGCLLQFGVISWWMFKICTQSLTFIFEKYNIYIFYIYCKYVTNTDTLKTLWCHSQQKCYVGDPSDRITHAILWTLTSYIGHFYRLSSIVKTAKIWKPDRSCLDLHLLTMWLWYFLGLSVPIKKKKMAAIIPTILIRKLVRIKRKNTASVYYVLL